MKKIITGALVIALSISAVQAQSTNASHGKGHKKGHQKEGRMHGPSHENLNLTAEQKAKVQSLHEQQRKEMETLRSNRSLSNEQRRTQQMELHQKHRAEFEAILTPEQRIQAQKMQEERKSTGHYAMGQGKRGKKGASSDDHIQHMDLNQDQQQKMKQINEEFKAKAEAIRNNQSLTKEQKKSQLDELKASRKDQMKSILTPEQKEKMQNKKKSRDARITK
jgi:Spy/CpxP family protein refolding chaperone